MTDIFSCRVRKTFLTRVCSFVNSIVQLFHLTINHKESLGQPPLPVESVREEGSQDTLVLNGSVSTDTLQKSLNVGQILVPVTPRVKRCAGIN